MGVRMKEFILKVCEWLMLIGVQIVLPVFGLVFLIFFTVAMIYGIKFMLGV